MSSGPEHYTTAEHLEEAACQPGLEVEIVMARLARAQVHATLALVAVTAEAAPLNVAYGDLVQYPRDEKSLGDWDPGAEGSPWGKVLSDG